MKALLKGEVFSEKFCPRYLLSGETSIGWYLYPCLTFVSPLTELLERRIRNTLRAEFYFRVYPIEFSTQFYYPQITEK
jgi:hypothetical protein